MKKQQLNRLHKSNTWLQAATTSKLAKKTVPAMQQTAMP